MARYDFASDNVAGAMPEALEALTRFNGGFEASYGADGVGRRAGDLIRGLLDADAEVWFTASGTAANALALATLVAPHEAVACHAAAHVAPAGRIRPDRTGRAGRGPGPAGPAALATPRRGVRDPGDGIRGGL